MQTGTNDFGVICRTGKAIRVEKYLLGLRSLCVLRSWVLLLSGWLMDNGAVLPEMIGFTSTT